MAGRRLQPSSSLSNDSQRHPSPKSMAYNNNTTSWLPHTNGSVHPKTCFMRKTTLVTLITNHPNQTSTTLPPGPFHVPPHHFTLYNLHPFWASKPKWDQRIFLIQPYYSMLYSLFNINIFILNGQPLPFTPLTNSEQNKIATNSMGSCQDSGKMQTQVLANPPSSPWALTSHIFLLHLLWPHPRYS